MYSFERLTLWQKSISLYSSIKGLTAQKSILQERYLVDQILRSSLSISLNVAEGCGSQNTKEYIRYLFIARKSLFELIATLKIIFNVYNINISKQLELCDEVGKLLNSYLNSLNKKEK